MISSLYHENIFFSFGRPIIVGYTVENKRIKVKLHEQKNYTEWVKEKFLEQENMSQVYLIPELKSFDYFLLIFGHDSSEIFQKIKK